MRRRILRLAATLLMALTTSIVGVLATAAPANADECYTYTRILRQGDTGADVRRLQIILSGYPGYDSVLQLDGIFSSPTKAALMRFQQAYGLNADGVAGTQTFNKIYALQDADCTPIYFGYADMNQCNTTWQGGAVPAATARFNALVTMWKLAALRHALGDRPIRITRGFLSHECNNALGGDPESRHRHLYGDAADLIGTSVLCDIFKDARYRGFREILLPAHPGHGSEIHVAHSQFRTWSPVVCV